MFAATSERAPEDELLGKLPEIFAKSAEHYHVLDSEPAPERVEGVRLAGAA